MRLGDTKTGASLRPLPEPAHAILAHLKRDGDYVFPGVSRADRSYASMFPRRGDGLLALTTPRTAFVMHMPARLMSWD